MRAKNMQSLTNDIKAHYPGVTIYGIGDDAHKTRTSDHNEDDTPGVRAEQSDSDNIPEHRAIDVMLGDSLSRDQARHLVQSFLNDKGIWTRLHYIIFEGSIYTKTNDGWVRGDHSDDPHNDHIHFSGDASDDDNTNTWGPVHDDPTPPPPPAPPSPPVVHVVEKGSTGDEVRHIQQFLHDVFPVYRKSVPVRRGVMIGVDGIFGDQTRAWVIEFQRRTGIGQDGVVGPITLSRMRAYGYKY